MLLPDWLNCQNILCIRLDQIGDILMTTPAIKALKETIPQCAITLLCSQAGQKIVPMIPHIDRTIVYDAPWMKASRERADTFQETSIIELLKSFKFDGAIIFNVFSQNPLPAAFLSYLSNIPRRLAYCRENPYHLLTHWAKDPEVIHPTRHEVQRQLDLVAMTGAATTDSRLVLNVPQESKDKVREIFLREEINPGKPVILIHPGASAPSRRYPAEQFAEVVNQLYRQLDSQIVFTAAREETGLIELIRQRISVPSYSMAGKLALPELCALISFSSILITNNTGPAHMAAALGTPVIDLYALTNPQHTPWKVPHRLLFHDVPCRFCYKSVCPQQHQDCLKKIKPEAVVEAVLDLLRDPCEDSLNLLSI